MELQKDSAIAASTLTKEAGVIAAEKHLIQAQTDYAQAGMALAGALSGAIFTIGGWLQSRSAYAEALSAPENQTLTPEQKMYRATEAATQAEKRWTSIGQSTERVTDAAQKFADAIMHQQLSSKEIQEATLKAATDLNRTLGDLQSQTASTLAQAVSGLDQEIKAIFDKYIEAMRGWAQAWGRG